MSQTADSPTSRTLSGTVTIELKGLDGISITLSSGAVFSGIFETGAFVGTYSSGGTTADVDVSMGGIRVDDSFFPYD